MDANKSNLHHYNAHLQPFANKLRKQMTKADACLWKYALRASMMKDYPFRRQKPVLKYIADFMCKDLMLIIEVDGLTHTWEETIIKDEKREAELKNAGFTILRFSDYDVLNNMENVKRSIYNWIEDFEAAKGLAILRQVVDFASVSPPPAPPPAGDILIFLSLRLEK